MAIPMKCNNTFCCYYNAGEANCNRWTCLGDELCIICGNHHYRDKKKTKKIHKVKIREVE